MGSGGGSVSQSGGSGGGIIVLNGNTVKLLSKSVLSANGVVATSETSGGGSGGSILVEASSLEFHGLVQADGGNGGENGGGGGGGGRIMFLIRNNSSSSSASLPSFSSLNAISHLSSQNSQNNYQYLQQDNSQLFTGNYSAVGGRRGMVPTTSLPFLESSSFIEGDGEDGTVWTTFAPCDAGYGTVFCTVCPAGTYKTERDVSPCTPCSNGPVHSEYTMTGQTTKDCPFTCLTGYRGNDCLRPYDEFLRQIGGWKAIVGISVLFIFVVLGCTLLIRQYNRRMSDLRERVLYIIDQNDHYCNYFCHSFDSQLGMKIRQYKQLEQSVPLAWYAQDIDRIRQKQKANSHYLTMGNLSDHVGRVYLNGHNTFRDPWRVPIRPPEYLIPLVFLPEYKSFRDDLNSLLNYSKFGEKLILTVLTLLFPPVAYFYYMHIRKKRATLFEEYISKGTHFFIRGPRAQALQESVKCGYDDKHSIAYIDILYLDTVSPPDGIELGSPSLPLNLAISGDGTALNPYTIGR